MSKQSQREQVETAIDIISQAMCQLEELKLEGDAQVAVRGIISGLRYKKEGLMQIDERLIN